MGTEIASNPEVATGFFQAGQGQWLFCSPKRLVSRPPGAKDQELTDALAKLEPADLAKLKTALGLKVLVASCLRRASENFESTGRKSSLPLVAKPGLSIQFEPIPVYSCIYIYKPWRIIKILKALPISTTFAGSFPGWMGPRWPRGGHEVAGEEQRCYADHCGDRGVELALG